MDDRQAAEIIMKALGLESSIIMLEKTSDDNKLSTLTMLKMFVEAGLRVEERQGEQKKERSKERKTIYNKTKRKNLKTKSTLPDLKFDADRDRQNVEKKIVSKKPKRDIPNAWLDAYDRQVVEDQQLIDYCVKKMGADKYYAKTQFLAFVEYHMSKGSMFVRWNYAFYKWIGNDIKWNGKPSTHSPGSVVQSYQPKNTIMELFND